VSTGTPTNPRIHLTVIGLGNEYLTDDGVGIHVVRALKKRLPAGEAEFQELPVGGLQLLEHISGTEHCIIVDAVTTGHNKPGTPYRFVQDAEDHPPFLRSSHQIDLAQVVTLAKMMGAALPRHLVVYGVEAGDITTFHEGCTEAVSRTIPKLVDTICRDLGDEPHDGGRGEWTILTDVAPD